MGGYRTIRPKETSADEKRRDTLGVCKEYKHQREHAKSRVKLLITYTNADVLTVEKLRELKDIARLKKPDVIIVAEVKPKNFVRDLENIQGTSSRPRITLSQRTEVEVYSFISMNQLCILQLF